MPDFKPVFRKLNAADVADYAGAPEVDSAGNVTATALSCYPKPTFLPPEFTTVKCESCGTQVAVLTIRIPGRPDTKRWVEAPYPTGRMGEFEMFTHTPERCQATRGADDV